MTNKKNNVLETYNDNDIWNYLIIWFFYQNNRDTGVLRHHRVHYDLTVMKSCGSTTYRAESILSIHIYDKIS